MHFIQNSVLGLFFLVLVNVAVVDVVVFAVITAIAV